MSKRILFTTGTPNDQGGIIPDTVIDFFRFNKNPVVLKEHRWGDDPIGLWTDIKKESEGWSGIPVFHGLTDESKRVKALYEGGWIRAASIGGEAIWKTNTAGQFVLDKNGYRICEKFYLYEISIVTLPSNQDAVQTEIVALTTKIYETGELDNINKSITTLSSKFYNNTMAKENEATQKETSPHSSTVQTTLSTIDPAAKPVLGEGRISLSASELPGFLEKIINGVRSVFTSTEKNTTPPKPENTPKSEKADSEIEQPKPTGLKAVEKAKNEAEEAREAAESAVKKAEKAKKKAEAEDSTDEDREHYKTCMKEAEKALKKAEATEATGKKNADNDDTNAASQKDKSTNSTAMMKPQIKTLEELRAQQTRLAAPPTEAAAHRAKVIREAGGKTFSQLASDKGEGRAVLNRVLTRDAGEKQISDYAIVLNSILNDGKYSAIREKMRVMMNVPEASLMGLKNNPNGRAGYSLEQLSAQLNSGQVEMLGRDYVMRTITKLNSSDDALASPALTAIEWLPLAIFKMFPSTSWKNEVPIFPAQLTGNNLGIVWANIAADPAVYKGNKPVNPADYTYEDEAVALKLVPYWLQPMRWTPLTMHYLRYDQMGTGWAQAFAKWGAVMDDDMIYSLASIVPAGSVVKSTGLSGYQTNADTFNIAGPNDPNSFIWNPAFTGNLKKPVLNDVIVLEQIYNKQNFNLEETGERVALVVDPTMERYLTQDPETKSLLTRWVNADGVDLMKFKHTIIHQRSRVAIYDPATSQVKDPSGVIPATSVSAGVSFIPSQVGMGLGMLDVFMIQDPSAYGYKMSADIRIGIVPLRKNYNGTAIYTYGSAV
jgi:hypothetical protein